LTWNCNFKCAYCNAKPAETPNLINPSQLIETVKSMVSGTNRFTIGNGMEPTIHPQFIATCSAIQELNLHHSLFSLQTNGRNLIKFSPQMLRSAGFNLVSVSLDVFIPSIAHFQRNGLRPGTLFRSIARILNESDIKIRVIIVVTALNIQTAIEFVEFCIQFGINIFTLRQVITRQSKEFFEVGGKTYPVRELEISKEAFQNLKRDVVVKFDSTAEFEFYDEVDIHRHAANTKSGKNWQASDWKNYIKNLAQRTGL